MWKPALTGSAFTLLALLGAFAPARNRHIAATGRQEIDEEVANRGLIQRYGLVGPVRLTPYATAAVR